MTDASAKDNASTENPFWDFSVALYDHVGIKEACLALQDRAGADVNMLLFLCWVGQSGRGRLTRAEVQAAMARIAVWRVQVVQPLRRVRGRLRRDGGAGEAELREELLKVELAAERVEQNRLYQGLKLDPVPLKQTAESRQSDARYNCSLYFREVGIVLDEALDDAVHALVGAATRI